MTSLTTAVETADKTNGKKWKQVFSDNMGKKGVPKVRTRAESS
jgi:DNA topoisomerase-2